MVNDSVHHDTLTNASPLERARHLLRMVEATEDACLRLPEREGIRLALHDLHFDADMLRTEIDLAQTEGRTPSWWHSDGRLLLRQASFRGANLEKSQLARVDLTGADFSGTLMRAAALDHAGLEQADFTGADLTATSFVAAAASQADFTEALLEDARFRGAILRFAKFDEALLEGADFTEADLWGAQFIRAEARGAKFNGATLREASLEGADLQSADLRGAQLQNSNLGGARLRGANLRGADLGRAKLDGADLADAELVQVNLLTCQLRHIRLAGAWMERTRLRIDQLGGAIGEDVAGEWASARQGYLDLEQNFRGLGDAEGASWCYRRARRMGKRANGQNARLAAGARQWRAAISHAFSWISDNFVEWLCDYGDSIPRVVRAYGVTLLAFAVFYWLSGSLVRPVESGGTTSLHVTHDFVDLLSFSFLNQITSTTPDLGLKLASKAVYVVSSLQYVVGVVLIGLFGFVLGNRIRR